MPNIKIAGYVRTFWAGNTERKKRNVAGNTFVKERLPPDHK
jgi:hypothetical protein